MYNELSLRDGTKVFPWASTFNTESLRIIVLSTLECSQVTDTSSRGMRYRSIFFIHQIFLDLGAFWNLDFWFKNIQPVFSFF